MGAKNTRTMMAYDYVILEHHDPLELAQLVKKHMYDGWKCQGGVSAVAVKFDYEPVHRVGYVQALVKEGEHG